MIAFFFIATRKTACRIEQTMAKYWWNDKEGRKCLHWTKWSNLCKPKAAGGLGFRSLQVFYQSLLAKQVWRVIQFPNSLMARLLKGRYFKNTDIMDAKLGCNSSFVWRSLLWGRDIIKEGLCWRVGNGKNILAHKYPWIPSIPSFTSTSVSSSTNNVKVERYILTTGG